MNRTRAMLGVLLAVGLVAGISGDVFAGLSARTDGGKYTGSRLGGTRGPRPAIWTDREGNGAVVLNPRGDQNGDLWPTVVESSVAPHHPWVVWSRFNGTDYDIAWSRWAGSVWEPIRWLEHRAMPGDDLDADLAFDVKGRPFVAWWRQLENGMGRIYISVYVGNKWLTATQVSLSSVDSRHPTIEVFANGKIALDYQTPAGTVRQMLLFSQPTTITDDINPQFKLIGEPTTVSRNLVD